MNLKAVVPVVGLLVIGTSMAGCAPAAPGGSAATTPSAAASSTPSGAAPSTPATPSAVPATPKPTATTGVTPTPGAAIQLTTGEAMLTGSWLWHTTTGPKPLGGEWTGPIFADRSRALPIGRIEAEWAGDPGGYLLLWFKTLTPGTYQTALGDQTAAVAINFIISYSGEVPIGLNESTGPGDCTVVLRRTASQGIAGTIECSGQDMEGGDWSLEGTYSGEP